MALREAALQAAMDERMDAGINPAEGAEGATYNVTADETAFLRHTFVEVAEAVESGSPDEVVAAKIDAAVALVQREIARMVGERASRPATQPRSDGRLGYVLTAHGRLCEVR